MGAVARLLAEAPQATCWSAQELLQLHASGIHVWVAVGEEGDVAGVVASREAADEVEILNLAVTQAWQRRGLGRRLMETALDAALSAGARRAFLEVRESNVTAQAFYQRLGFVETGRRRNYYHHPVEDALLLSRTFG
jgi:ribosomal-protein-alanine N-acetyltransferase